MRDLTLDECEMIFGGGSETVTITASRLSTSGGDSYAVAIQQWQIDFANKFRSNPIPSVNDMIAGLTSILTSKYNVPASTAAQVAADVVNNAPASQASTFEAMAASLQIGAGLTAAQVQTMQNFISTLPASDQAILNPIIVSLGPKGNG